MLTRPSGSITPSRWTRPAAAGPSGIGGEVCSVDGGAAVGYSASGPGVNGTGVHRISCTAWNRAIDPNGNDASATSSISVRVDETPPTIAFEPEDPNNPAAVVVDTSDAKPDVAGGSIQLAPAARVPWRPAKTRTASAAPRRGSPPS